MADMNKLLGQLLGSGAAGGFAGGLAGGLTSSLLTSKSGRKIGTKALKMGGIAAVGALAYAAYQRYSTGKDTAPNGLNHWGWTLQTRLYWWRRWAGRLMWMPSSTAPPAPRLRLRFTLLQGWPSMWIPPPRSPTSLCWPHVCSCRQSW